MLFHGKKILCIIFFAALGSARLYAMGLSTSTTSSYMPQYFSLSQSVSLFATGYLQCSVNASAAAVGNELLTLNAAGASVNFSPDTKLQMGLNVNQTIPRAGFYNTSVGVNLSYGIFQSDNTATQMGVVLNRSISVQNTRGFAGESEGDYGVGKIGQYSLEFNLSETLWYRTTISMDFSTFWYDISPASASKTYMAFFQRGAVTGRVDDRLLTLMSTADSAQRYSAGVNVSHQLTDSLSLSLGMNLNTLWLRGGISAGQNASLSLSLGVWSLTYGVVRSLATVFIREREFIETNSLIHSLTVGRQW